MGFEYWFQKGFDQKNQLKVKLAVSPPAWIMEMTKRFRWKTMKGEVLSIDQMATSHIFNCMKMMFNHIADKHGGRPVWFLNKYNHYQEYAVNKDTLKDLVKHIAFFVWHIENREDLPEKYKVPYAEIMNQIFNIKYFEDDRQKILEDFSRLVNIK